jgi:hypothetical protein
LLYHISSSFAPAIRKNTRSRKVHPKMMKSDQESEERENQSIFIVLQQIVPPMSQLLYLNQWFQLLLLEAG